MRKSLKSVLYLIWFRVVPRMQNRMTLSLFAKKLGYRRADAKEFHEGVRYLSRAGALMVKQGGFIGDSLHHPKIVFVKDWNAVNLYFQLQMEEENRMKKRSTCRVVLHRFTCALPDVKCTSRKFLKRQGMICSFEGTCNQKRLIKISPSTSSEKLSLTNFAPLWTAWICWTL